VSIVSIDPGLHVCGVALWEHEFGNKLIWAGLVKNDKAYNRTMIYAVERKLADLCGHKLPDRLAIEIPQVYVRSRSKGDPNDLIQLATVVGAFDYWFQGLVFQYKPHDWKGSTPKDVTKARAKKRLTTDEQKRIETVSAEGLMHNVWDSVALGLFHLRREPRTP